MRGKQGSEVEDRFGVRLIPAHAGKTSTTATSRSPARAHPRSCGENDLFLVSKEDTPGSSPLMRGKRRPSWRRRRGGGLIPAHTGKTSSSHCTKITRRAHPRSHGENSPQKSFVSGVTGSSPLTRGKRRRIDPVPETVGLIPAHAGTTSGSCHWHQGSRAHPRSRGENASLGRGTPLATGSSPLTRGKPQHLLTEQLENGLIPTHTGKTASSKSHRPRTRAHPRSRGENRAEKAHPAFQKGSSPLMRGKHDDTAQSGQYEGLIPAHAGKTVLCRLVWPCWWARPRSCGENAELEATPILGQGLSPLMRGKLACMIRRARCIGLIRAHAGKTSSFSWLLRRSAAHPRSYGENSSASWSIEVPPGSSPLMRGKRWRRR